MADEILRLEHVSKKFCRSLKRSMYYGAQDVLRGLVGLRSDHRTRLRTAEFWAVKDVSFSLERGETLGLIGSNGSGKSTLLRLISGIYPPDEGRIEVRGKIGALISLGAGFHPQMTGRQNIYVNGTILGMSKTEIDRKFDEIVEFSELGDFLDAPVSSYSSGMTVRLGFSIAAHSDAELLIVDEVLSVGDLAFSLKCHRKMSQFRQSGGTMILVSHNNQLIRNTCKKAFWLKHGVPKAYGPVHEVCSEYEYHLTKDFDAGKDAATNRLNYDPSIRFEKVQFLDEHDRPTDVYRSGEFFKLRLWLDSKRKIVDPIVTISIFNAENVQVISNYSHFDGARLDVSGRGFIDFSIQKLSLQPSKYFVSVTLAERDLGSPLEWHEKGYSFSVKGGDLVSYGLYNPYPVWRMGTTELRHE